MPRRVLFLIAQENFREEELQIPSKVFRDSGYKVTIASIERAEALGMLGSKVMPDLALREANAGEYDALIVVGGSGSPSLAEYPEVLSVVRRFAAQGKPIGAICLAPYVLAKAGVLKGKRATCWPADFALVELRRQGAQYVDEGIVKDGKFVTAQGPEQAEEFAKQVLELLK